MQRLIDGYTRFRSEVFPQNQSLFQQLANTQKPEVLFISCSDSRVMPEMILQNRPGEIFSIRNAGNLVPRHDMEHGGVSASVEYAVTGLKVNDIVVCGHSGCGAMKEILERAHVDDMPLVQSWLRHAGPSSQWLSNLLNDTVTSTADKNRLLIEANVIAQMTHLAQHPSVVAERETREVNIHGWVFDIASGEIHSFNAETGKFEPILQRHEALTRELQIA